MMGSGELGVSICSTTLRLARRLWTLNEIAAPIVPRGTIRFALSGKFAVTASCRLGAPERDGCTRLLAEAEFSAVAPHAVEDDRELAGDRYTGARHTSRLSDLHAPGPQARPFPAANQQGMGRLIERGAGELVAAAADLTLDVGLARLVARRGQAKMRAHVARSSEAVRPVDCRPKGERRDRTDARNTHQPAADCLLPDDVLHLL